MGHNFSVYCVTIFISILIFISGHGNSIRLSVTPNYILGGTALALSCSLEKNVFEPWVTFHKDAILIGFIRNCTENGFTPCSLTTKCDCDLNSKTYIWNYTTSKENVNAAATFNCTMDGSQSDEVTVQKAGKL